MLIVSFSLDCCTCTWIFVCINYNWVFQWSFRGTLYEASNHYTKESINHNSKAGEQHRIRIRIIHGQKISQICSDSIGGLSILRVMFIQLWDHFFLFLLRHATAVRDSSLKYLVMFERIALQFRSERRELACIAYHSHFDQCPLPYSKSAKEWWTSEVISRSDLNQKLTLFSEKGAQSGDVAWEAILLQARL